MSEILAAKAPQPKEPMSFPHEVKRVAKTIDTERKYSGLTTYTELIEMDDGIKYVATINDIESDKIRAVDPDNRQYPGSDILVLEGSAWTTKYGKMYEERDTELALDLHRPSIFVGVQQNLDRFNTLARTADDMLAIHAFYAMRFNYDPDNLTGQGTSRGAMLSNLLQKRAGKYGKRMLYNYSMVPCIPFPSDGVRMLQPSNLVRLAINEVEASKSLELSPTEFLQMYDMLDVFSVRGLTQQIKEGLALLASDTGTAIRDAEDKSDVGDIKVQRGDRMSFAKKWPDLYAEYPYVKVDVKPSNPSAPWGGHFSCIGKQYHDEWYEHAEASSRALHLEKAARELTGHALREIIDINMTTSQKAA